MVSRAHAAEGGGDGTDFIPTDPTVHLTPKKHSSSWLSIMSNCAIFYFIHIPKTGGSSVNRVLHSFPNYHKLPKDDGGSTYTADPQATMASLQKNVFNTTAYQVLSSTNTTNTAMVPHIITSLEKGIFTLQNNDYPAFPETCFFATVQNPYEWVLSAQNHMRSVGQK